MAWSREGIKSKNTLSDISSVSSVSKASEIILAVDRVRQKQRVFWPHKDRSFNISLLTAQLMLAGLKETKDVLLHCFVVSNHYITNNDDVGFGGLPAGPSTCRSWMNLKMLHQVDFNDLQLVLKRVA